MRKPPRHPSSFKPARPGHDHARGPERGPRPTGSSLPPPSVARTALLYGIHVVAQAWLNPERRCRRLYATEAALAEMAPALQSAASQGLKRPEALTVQRYEIDNLLPPGAVHQGIALDAEALPEVGLDDVLIAASDGPALLLLLDQVTDPHNVGAILRSAAAFGAKGVIVQRRHAPEITGVLAKAASGAADIVPMLRETNLARALTALAEAGFLVIGLDERGEATLAETPPHPRIVLALGAEGTGLRRLVAEQCGLLARLPTTPPIASLNVSNAAAVALYEIARRRSL